MNAAGADQHGDNPGAGVPRPISHPAWLMGPAVLARNVTPPAAAVLALDVLALDVLASLPLHLVRNVHDAM